MNGLNEKIRGAPSSHCHAAEHRRNRLLNFELFERSEFSKFCLFQGAQGTPTKKGQAGLYGKRAGINPAPYGKGDRNDDQGPNLLAFLIVFFVTSTVT